VHCKSLWRKDSIDADLFSSFECFPEHDKEYKWRLGLTIVAAVLTHSSSILVGVIMLRFVKEEESESGEERDPIEQDRGSSQGGSDDGSEVQLDSSSESQFDCGEAQLENKARAQRTIMYKTGLGLGIVFLSLILTGCFHRNSQFPVVCNITSVYSNRELTQTRFDAYALIMRPLQYSG
jgi:hypothetical protein